MSVAQVRLGKKSDAKAVGALLRVTWADTYSNVFSSEKLDEIALKWHDIDVLEKQIADPENCFLVAEIMVDKKSELIGHALARLKADNVIWLSRLYIQPTAQGNGAGNALFSTVLETYSNAQSIRLEVGPENQPAINFYKYLGFVQIGESNCCGGNIDTPALVMEMVLSDV